MDILTAVYVMVSAHFQFIPETKKIKQCIITLL